MKLRIFALVAGRKFPIMRGLSSTKTAYSMGNIALLYSRS
jgi:hypothetical protein